MEIKLIEMIYSQDTFFLLMSGALVMWMAAGFAMLEAGMVRTKSVAEILTKNIALYSIACIMYMFVGYNIMYGGSDDSWIPSLSFSSDRIIAFRRWLSRVVIWVIHS